MIKALARDVYIIYTDSLHNNLDQRYKTRLIVVPIIYRSNKIIKKKRIEISVFAVQDSKVSNFATSLEKKNIKKHFDVKRCA